MTELWDPSSEALITQQVVEHIWRVEFPGLDATRQSVPAWDIEVSLDGGRSPYGTASFKAPVSYMAEVPDGGGTVFTELVPYSLPPVCIYAGWRHDVGGAATDDLQVLFSGYVTARRLIIEEGKGFVQFEAQSAEVLYEFPSNRVYDVIDTHTAVSQTITSVNTSGTPWYRQVQIANEPGFLNTPDAGQLIAFRALEIAVDDEVMDFIRTCAATLNQWLRGDIRQATTPGLLNSVDPYPYRTAYTVPAGVFSRIERVDDIDQWANILKLTCQWGDPVTVKRRTVLGAGAGVGNTGAVRSRDVTLNLKPPGGNIPASWGISDKWLRRIKDLSEVAYTATGRAIWWLQPRIHGLAVSGLGLADVAGPISTVSFQVDVGTMTVTWTTNNLR